MTMYQGKEKFTREQIIFVVECILLGAQDRIAHGMPTSGQTNHVDSYDEGALDAASQALVFLYSRLTGVNISRFATLQLANKFNETIAALAWNSGHPDCHQCAVSFADWMLSNPAANRGGVISH